jgi:adenylosuccinate lyase
MQLKGAFEILIPQIEILSKTLLNRAKETEDLIAVGRSHGQHAVPITYGIRFAVWSEEIYRHKNRLIQAMESVSVGKISGATGSHAALGPQGFDIQKKVLTQLGLNVPVATTQIIQRDRIAEAITSLANLASSIDKIATNLRNLQRTEIAETYEPFAKGKQVGSSAMPHKRNPVTTEKLSGLARIVRSQVPPALENVVSWEERDISHSSAERFIIPQTFILTDYMIRELSRVIDGLTIDEEAVVKNLNLSKDSILSEYVVTLLTKVGLERPKAHEKLRALSSSAKAAETSLLDAVSKDEELTDILDVKQLKLEEYYNNIRETSRRIVKEAHKRE